MPSSCSDTSATTSPAPCAGQTAAPPASDSSSKTWRTRSFPHRGVEDIARPQGVVTLAGSSDEDPEQERRLAAAFTARRVDGLIVVPDGDDHAYLLRERAAG